MSGNNGCEWSWRTRARAWIFGMADSEMILGTADTGILDGESYQCSRVFAAGKTIPDGESAKVSKLAAACSEYHYCQEMTVDDLLRSVAARRYAITPGHAFWCEPKSKDRWRVCYAARKGTSAIDLLCLRDRMAQKGQAKLFVATKSWRMKAMSEGIENA